MNFKRKNIFKSIVTVLVLVLAMGLSVAFADESGTQADGDQNYERSYSAKSISSIESDLNNNYKEYKKGYKTLEFKYDIKESSSTITIEMTGKNFERTSTAWQKRDSDEFRNFVESVARKVADEIDNKVIEIELEDEDSKETGKYEYRFKVTEEYGQSDDNTEIADELNKKYDDYTKGDYDLKFKYEVSETSSKVTVKMKGTNFERDGKEWDKRDDSDFRDFVEDVAGYAAKEADKDAVIEVTDEDGKDAAEYKYDESSRKLGTVDEYDKDDDSNDIENYLNKKYDEYTKGDYELKFKYTVKEATKEVKVTMRGTNFERDGKEWEKRDEKDFQDFVEDLAKYVEKEADKDVEIELEDEDGKETGEYEYDESRKRFKVVKEHEADSDSEIEKYLNDKFEEYSKGKYDLKFKYEVKESSKEVKVEMKGTNFEYDGKEWDNRDKDDFRDFVQDIAEYVAKKTDKDVEIDLEDEDGKETGEYEYDESSKKFKVKSEKGSSGSDDIDDIEKDLNKDYDRYKKEDYEFKYDLSETSSYVKITMTAENFKKSSSKWTKRDKGDFRDFVEEFAEDVCERTNKDIRVYVKDENKDSLARYDYDKDKEKLEVEYEK